MDLKAWARAVKDRDGWTCCECGNDDPDAIYHAHHIQPQALGGQNTLSNGITLCNPCHRQAHSGDMSSQAIGAKNTSPITIRDASFIFGVTDVAIRNWRRKGILPLHLDYDAAVKCIKNGAAKHGERVALYRLEHVVNSSWFGKD